MLAFMVKMGQNVIKTRSSADADNRLDAVFTIFVFKKFHDLERLQSAIAKVRHSKGLPSQKARAAYTGRRNLNLMGGYTREIF